MALQICTVSVTTELRESVTRNQATPIVARMTASEPVNIKANLRSHNSRRFCNLWSYSQFFIRICNSQYRGIAAPAVLIFTVPVVSFSAESLRIRKYW